MALKIRTCMYVCTCKCKYALCILMSPLPCPFLDRVGSEFWSQSVRIGDEETGIKYEHELTLHCHTLTHAVYNHQHYPALHWERATIPTGTGGNTQHCEERERYHSECEAFVHVYYVWCLYFMGLKFRGINALAFSLDWFCQEHIMKEKHVIMHSWFCVYASHIYVHRC